MNGFVKRKYLKGVEESWAILGLGEARREAEGEREAGARGLLAGHRQHQEEQRDIGRPEASL